jgi:hypothetical protein
MASVIKTDGTKEIHAATQLHLCDRWPDRDRKIFLGLQVVFSSRESQLAGPARSPNERQLSGLVLDVV